MKNILISALLVGLISSYAAVYAQETTEVTYNIGAEFDWASVPASSASIGDFPYIMPPTGFVVSYPESEGKPWTEYYDYNQLIIPISGSEDVILAEGERAHIRFDMVDDAEWNQFKFDKSVQKYLDSIGAVEVFSGEFPSALVEQAEAKVGSQWSDFVAGDPWNDDPYKMYALNHASAKVFFQVWSNSASGEIDVVRLEGFEQTIKAPTATEMKQQLDADGKVILHINFDVNKATYQPDGQAIIDQIFLLLDTNPELKLAIEGHTDNSGSPEHNMPLSQRRADTVRYALAGKGINIERLTAKGFGDTQPMVENDSDENKAQNRRVELIKQ